ncbi:MAG: hypothetical protein ACRCU9_16555 [Iodobacter sp.]
MMLVSMPKSTVTVSLIAGGVREKIAKYNAISVKNSPDKINKKISDGFLINKLKINNELKLIRKCAEEKSAPDNKIMPLASYLLARSILNKTIDDTRLAPLLKANDSVTSAREKLSFGRGNVRADLQKSQEARWRTAFCRDLNIDLPHHGQPELIAKALLMKAGNCGEYGDVVTYIHAAKLGEKEKIFRVHGTKGFDHAWAELEAPGGSRIIMDAWADGPAILAEDSAFSYSKKKRQVMDSYDQQEGLDLINRADHNLLKLKGSRHSKNIALRWDFFKVRSEQFDNLMPQKKMWGITPVLADRIKGDVLDQLQRSNVAGVLKKEGLNTRELKVSRQIDLGVEIKMLGVAGALGWSIKQGLGARSIMGKEFNRFYFV